MQQLELFKDSSTEDTVFLKENRKKGSGDICTYLVDYTGIFKTERNRVMILMQELPAEKPACS